MFNARSTNNSAIKMNSEAAMWFMSHLDDSSDDAPPATKKWLEGLGLPLDLLRFMQWHWTQEGCFAGPVKLRSSAKLPKEHNSKILTEHQLLPVGIGPNGDTFAIDYSSESCPVGFITHEEYAGKGDPRPFFRPAARSLESFLYRVIEGRYVPCDYYATGYHNEVLRAEASHDPFPPYRPIKAEP